VGGNSAFSKLVPAEEIEQSAAQQYAQMLAKADQQRALAGKEHPQLQRLRAIARRIIPYANEWNPRAKNWQWEVNLIGSKQINAFCMPGGKIAFYTGILDTLKLTDDEVAMVMGHEIAHALREHARERMGKTAATGLGANLLSQVLGLGQVGQTVHPIRRAVIDFKVQPRRRIRGRPRWGWSSQPGRATTRAPASVCGGRCPLPTKMPRPQWLSTHPAGDTRIADMEAAMPQVVPLYNRAQKPSTK